MDELNRISEEIFKENPIGALQYSLTEGYTPLRDLLKKELEKKGEFDPERDDLIITSGAQQANELACKVLCDPGDILCCEAPSFIGSLNAFKSYNVELKGITLHEDGVDLKELEEAGGDAKKAEELNKDNVEKHEEVDKDEYKTSNDGTVGSDLVKYTCSHCGAEIITDRSTAATVCVYCGNAVIMGEQIIDNFSPDYVIPFKVPKTQVMDVFKKFSNKPLTPKDFNCDRVVDKMQGVYIPFWLYSGNCEGSITAEGINTRTWTSGNYRYTEKKYYSVYRNGTLDFKAVPVDASSKTDDDAMDSIEPFDYSEMTAFNPGYLSGYLAERYDEDKDKCLPRAKERIENTTRDELRNTCNYNSVNVQSYEKHTEIKDVKYAMLPTWLLYTTYQDKPYFFAMNGQTGKFIGNLPISKGKLVAYSLLGGVGGYIIGAILQIMGIF